MTFRLVLAAVLLLLPATGHAVDCVKIENGWDDRGRLSEWVSPSGKDCGPLKIIDRRRDDPSPKVNIYANYVVFDPARNAAERRYNEWIGRRAATMNFSGPVDTSNGDVADTMNGGLYRSRRLLSASMGGWLCCGAHGSSWQLTLAIDPETGRDIALGELVEVDKLTDFCWQQFSELTGPVQNEGKEFSIKYPREVFRQYASSRSWSVGEGGLGWFFGDLLGYVGAEFDCSVKNEDLRRFTKPGVTVPF